MIPELNSLFHKHIEYTYVAGKMMRVQRPFKHGPYFLMPMESIEAELAKDLQRKCQPPPTFPSPNDCEDPNELRDYHNNKII